MTDNRNAPLERDLHNDVLVIGGGPGGTTIATRLHQQGWHVVLLEQDHHPRFHIGESLLPMNLPILEQLGVLEQVRAIGVVKHGAEFNPAETPGQHQTIYFRDALNKEHPYAFQVRRSEFDHLLFQNCAAKGVAVYEGVKVQDVQFRPGQTSLVHTVDEQGQVRVWESRFVVDASGRDTFLARKLGGKRKNPRHQSAAIFGHFRNVTRRPGNDAGNISLYWFQHGWFWMIPLRDDVMSVGAVCWPEYLKTRRVPAAEFLQQTIALCPDIQARMQAAAAVGEVRVTGNYSYRNDRMYGDGYLLVGDAFAFIDPVFSTGVYLAMNSAVLGAEAVDTCLREPARAARALARFDRQVRYGIGVVSWFIYRFTAPAMQELFMAPRNVLRIQEGITSMLAGDLFRRTPITLPLLAFKMVYYLTSALRFSRAWAAYQRRRLNAALTFSGGTTPQDQT
jgi:flavin-dependent dehydrogenase